MSSKNARKQINPIFGIPSPFTENVLPTYQEVIKHYFWLRGSVPQTIEPSFQEVGYLVVEKLVMIWRKTSIPIVSRSRIFQMLRSYHSKYRSLMKSAKHRQGSLSMKKNITTFQKHAVSSLFDLAACKCKDFNICCCPKKLKVPKKERPFLFDQRNKRKMRIAPGDKVVSAYEKRKAKDEARLGNYKKLKQMEASISGSSRGIVYYCDVVILTYNYSFRNIF